jgi:hypothetical protein
MQCVQATYLDPKTANKADLDIKKRTYASPSGSLVSLQKHEGREKNISEGAEDSENSKGNKNNKNEIGSITFIAEGVETGLSIKDSVKNGGVAVTLGKSNFATIDPHGVGQKIVFCLDNDGVQSVTDNAIHKAAQRLAGYGKEVFIAIPDQIKGINGAKTDFNDIARKEGINVVRKYINNSISYEQFNKNLNLEKVKEINNKDDYTASNSNKTRDRNMDISVGVVQEPKQPGSFDINKKISLDLEI